VSTNMNTSQRVHENTSTEKNTRTRGHLSDGSQFVFVNDDASITTNVSHGVPQGSVLGPILFTVYMLPLGNIIRKHSINFHCYADDTQQNLSIKPEESNQLGKIQACLKDIKHG